MPRNKPTELQKIDIINMIRGGVDPVPEDVDKGWYHPGSGWNKVLLSAHSFRFLLNLYKKRRRQEEWYVND
jgi:hypothetical protein